VAVVGTAYIKIKAITTDFKREADAAYEKFFRMVTTGYAIGPALATAVGGISSMVSGLVALSSQIAAALPSLIVLPSVFSAIGQAAVAAKMAFSGMGAAMKALQKKGGGGGGDNSKRVEEAEKRLAEVLERNREALARANDRLTEAEERLTKAREEASESLQQLNFDAEDAALSEKKAAIELEKARETLARVQDLPPNSRARREAELAYQEADLNMRRAKDRNADLAEETEKRNKLGIEGQEEVVQAQKAVQEAVDARAKAELDALKSLIDAQERLEAAKKGGGGGGSAADAEALSKLSAEARLFAEYLVSLQPKLQELRHAAGKELFGPLTGALDNIVTNLFPTLQPILQKTGAALGKTAQDFSKVVTEGKNLDKLTRIGDTNADTIGKLGTVFGNLYDVMLSLLDAADPLVRRFTDWIVTLTGGWRETAQLKNETGQLRDTFTQAGDIAAQLGRALGKDGLFGALMNIGKAASGPGSGGEMLLDTFEKSMKKFDEFTQKLLDDGSLADFFMKASVNFSKISTLVVGLGKEFLKLGDDAAIGQTADALGGVAPVIGEVFEVLQKAGPALGEFVGKLVDFVSLFAESQSINIFFGVLSTAVGALTAIFSNEIVMKVVLFTSSVLAVAKAFSVMFRVGKFVFLLLTKYVGTLLMAYDKLKFAMFALKYLFVTTATPILALVAGIAAVIAIFALAYANSEKLREALKALYEKVLQKVIDVFNEVKAVVEEVIGSFGSAKGAGDTFKDIFKTIGDFIATYFVPVLENMLMPIIDAVGNAFKAIIYIIGAVIKVFQGIYEFIRGVFSLITGDVEGAKTRFGNSFKAIAKAFEFAFKAIKEVFLDVWNLIKAAIAPILPIFKVIFGAILAVIKFVFNAVWGVVKFVFNAIVAYVKFVFNVYKAIFNAILAVIKFVFNTAWSVVKFVFDGIVSAVRFVFSIFSTIFNSILSVIRFVFNTALSIVTRSIDGWKKIISFVWDNVIKPIFEAFLTVFTTVWNGITTVFSTAWNAIKAVFTTVWDGIKSGIETGVNVIKTVIEKLVGIFTTVFNKIKGIVNSVFDGLSGAFKGVINAVLATLEGGLNFVIKGLNTILDGIDKAAGPWVNFGSIPEVKLPRLAKGGVVTSPVLAMVGEGGRPERIEPLDPDGLSKRDKAMIKFLTGGVQDRITMNIYPSEGMSETELASKISRELALQLRRGAA
jgi:phage-related protein